MRRLLLMSIGGSLNVMVIDVVNGIDDPSSNPAQNQVFMYNISQKIKTKMIVGIKKNSVDWWQLTELALSLLKQLLILGPPHQEGLHARM